MSTNLETPVSAPEKPAVERDKIPADRWRTLWHKSTPYWFMSPYILIFGIFGIFPVFFMIFLSFHTWNPVAGLGSMEFVGLENYALSLTDPTLWQTLKNTILMALYSGVPQHLVALPMAYLLVQLGKRARHWLTTAYFLPYVTSTIAVSMIFFVMFSKESGIINQALTGLANGSLTGWAFGWINDLMPIGWVQENSLIRYSVSFVVFWKYVGFNIVIYTTGLATISDDLYEAAIMDGANAVQRFFHIALPLLRPFIFFGVTLTIIGNMNLFDEPYVLTRGLQQASTNGMTISNYLYRVAWEWLDMGGAAAISWILFVVIGAFTGFYFWFFGRRGLEAIDMTRLTAHINLRLIGRAILWAALLTGVFMTVFPFFWSLLMATHDRSTMFSSGLNLSLGDQLIANYARLLDTMDFWVGMLNSFSVSIIGTIASLLFCSMCGYALAVYQFRGRNVLFGMMICSMMLPPILTLIPYYMVIDAIGLTNTHLAVWLPFSINPFGIFLIRQYVVASVPRDLLEAAKLDGASAFRTYWSVVLPLLRPGLATLAIVQFVFLWNNFLQPLVVLTSSEKMVITQMLRSVQGIPNTPWGALMLGTFISILPLVGIYMAASRQMISGLTSGAVKN